MNRYVLITDEPRKIRELHRNPEGWTETRFANAAEALAWEREMVASGFTPLDSQGWTCGVTFREESCRHGWVADLVA